MAMQVPTEEDILAGAIAGTEQEIFDEATGQAEDENNGDRSLEEMDDDIPGETEEGDESDEEEPDGEAEDEEGEDDIEAEASSDDDQGQQDAQRAPGRDDSDKVPSWRLREERERRETVERQLAAFQAQQQQRQQPQQEQPAEPDIWTDHAAWAANERTKIVQELTARQVNASLAEAHEAHGEEFVAAYKALTSLPPNDPIARATVQRIWDSPNSGKAIMRWHGEQQILRQAGGDPAAYKQNVAKELMSDPEFRRQMLAEMRGEAERGDGGRPRTTTRLPKSLNGASGGGSARNSDPELYNESDASAFAFAMK